MIRLNNRRAQGTLEYAVLFAIVVAAIIAMHSYMRRAVQARLKSTELALNEERNR